MSSISFTRIKQLWIQHTICSKRSLITHFIGLFCGLYMIHVLGIISRADINFYAGAFLLSFTVFMAVYLSGTFEVMNTKEKRINYLSFPAKTPEKFIAYASWYIIVPIVLFTAAYLLSELPRALTVLLIGNPQQKAAETILLPRLSGAILTWTRDDIRSIDQLLFLISFNACSASLFVLGSCLWYKKVFLKTVATVGITTFLGMTLISLISNIMEDCGISRDTINSIFFFTQPWEYGFWFLSVSLTIGTVFVWWGSYRLFKHREVISQKRNWFSLFKQTK